MQLSFSWLTTLLLTIDCPWFANGLSMDSSRIVYGLRMDCPCNNHGLTMELSFSWLTCLLFDSSTSWITMDWDCPWTDHGLTMDCSWIAPGLPMDCSLIEHGTLFLMVQFSTL
jgi:hypothetical protein